MPDSLRDLMERMKALQNAVESELEEKRKEFRYTIEKRKVVFEADVRLRQKQFKVGLGAFLKETRFLTLLTAPFIYGVIVPLVLLDLVASVYQFVCFPVYGIGKVRRKDYIFLAKAELRLLRLWQRGAGLCHRNRSANRAILVPDQARLARGGGAWSLCLVSGFR
jgi:hypothetical protein